MFIRTSKPFCAQDYLGALIIFGRYPSNCHNGFWPLLSVNQCSRIYGGSPRTDLLLPSCQEIANPYSHYPASAIYFAFFPQLLLPWPIGSIFHRENFPYWVGKGGDPSMTEENKMNYRAIKCKYKISPQITYTRGSQTFYHASTSQGHPLRITDTCESKSFPNNM